MNPLRKSFGTIMNNFAQKQYEITYLKFVFFFLFFSISLQSIAQLPSSNLYHCEYRLISDSLILSDIKWLNSFHKKGYNNQGFFVSDDAVLLSSDWPEKNQTDIVELDLKNSILSKMTETVQSEYSPTLMPSKKEVSVIRVQENGDQVLWKYPLDRSGQGQQIIKDLNNVGYHVWFHSTKLAMFLVGEPHLLVEENLLTGERKQLDINIGRSLHIRSGKLHYVKKTNDNNWHLKTYDPNSGEFETLIKTPNQSEDFVIIPNGTYLMGNSSKILAYHPLKNDKWIQVGDFKDLAWNNINRMQVRKNKLLIVNSLSD